MAMESTTRRYGEGSGEWADRAEQAGDKAKQSGEQAKEKVMHLGETAKMKAAEFGGKAKDMADAQKDKVDTRLEEAGHYLRNRAWTREAKRRARRSPSAAGAAPEGGGMDGSVGSTVGPGNGRLARARRRL